MGQFLFYYERPEPSTWVYLSSFLVIGVYFMFHRLWSLRNLDIALLILLTPGLMMVYEGGKKSDAVGKSIPVDSRKLAVTGLISEERGDKARLGHLISLNQENPSKATSDENVPSEDPTLSKKKAAETSSKTQQELWTGPRLQYWGFVWLLSVCGLLVIRMLLDTAMVRRPLLEPNLSSGGLAFIGVSLFLFLMANVLTSTPEEQRQQGGRLGPGYVLLNLLPAFPTTPEMELNPTETQIKSRNAEAKLAERTREADSKIAEPIQSNSTISDTTVSNATVSNATVSDSISEPTEKDSKLLIVARILAIVANLVLVLGIVAIAAFHFGNMKTGVGAAALILLLPYTAQMSGRVDHVLPGSLLVIAILLYRRPVFSGFFLGCAAGLVYYPFFLLPLWLSFYWQRGVRRFVAGFFAALLGLTVALVVYSEGGLLNNLQQMYGVFLPAVEGLGGIWGLGWHPYFRVPVLVAFVVLCLSFVFWPAQKNLATLMSCSAAIMTAAQFWHGYGGGLYMAWFLPLVLLTIFRPNLDDRIALSMVRPSGRRDRPSRDSHLPTSEPLAQAG